MRSRKKGTVCIITGLLLIGAALALWLYNQWDAHRADVAAQTVAAQLEEVIPETPSLSVSSVPLEALLEREMPTVEVDGYRYIGLLEVPSLDLTLPVMDSWDYDRLKISPCRYAGSVYQNDLVIAGHNYARHFSSLKWLSTGTEIRFIDAEGNVYRYEVAWIETISPEDTEQMVSDSDQWDLTLFTCTTGGTSRCTIRCIRIA